MRVLIAVDETHSSKATIESVIKHRWPEGTGFHLISAVHPAPFEMDRHTLKAGHALVARFSEELTKRANGQVVWTECLEGSPKKIILDAAESTAADLIVVGAHNERGIERLILGNVSQSILEHAPCPVLVVRDCDPQASLAFKRILFPIDGSPHSQMALDWLFTQDWCADTEFCFIHVAAQKSSKKFEREDIEQAMADLETQSNADEKLEAEIETALSNLTPKLGSYKHSVEALRGAPAEQILHFASQWQADLIVMGSHGRTGLEKALLGSVSLTVASHATSSVLIVKPLVKLEPATALPDDYYRDDSDSPHNMPVMM